MKIAVIGGGKMGLPLACQFAGRGGDVTVCDTNSELVDTINLGQCPFDEPELDERLANAVESGKLKATTDTAAGVAQAGFVVVIVPVLLTPDKKADLRIIESVTEQIAESMTDGTVISYETTLPVGTTRTRLLPILQAKGKKEGRDFFLVFSPERVKSQMVFQRLTENPKIVGGVSQASEDRGGELYKKYLGAPVRKVGSAEAAEFVKLAGMVYRDVNIALANELARYAESKGIDMPSLIDDINTDGEAALLTPGIGVGGHCTPVYPHFVLSDAAERRQFMPVTQSARMLNDEQPGFIVKAIENRWGSLAGLNVLILGLAFRPGVKESLYSPAYELAEKLKQAKARPFLWDPLYSENEIESHGFEPGNLKQAQVMILNTAHEVFRKIDFEGHAKGDLKLVVDGRNLWTEPEITKHGLAYMGIGRRFIADGTSKTRVVPLSRVPLKESDCHAVSNVIRSGWIMQGPAVERFEQDFAKYTGANHACAVSSGTAALTMALMALNIGPGDEVITVSHSFIASANCIVHVGATPVFADIDPLTYNIDPSQIEQLITPKTKAIIAVHQMGMPCDMAKLLAIANRHSLPVIEDAACALGSEIKVGTDFEKIGKPHGLIACFSFHPRKLVSTGDGGMLTTNDTALDKKFRLLRNHGMSYDTARRDKSSAYTRESFVLVGYNFRMTDLQAALGIEQLARLNVQLAARRLAASRYLDSLKARCPTLGLPQDLPWTKTNWQSFCLRLPDKDQQTRIINELKELGITTKPGITCAHREPAYHSINWRCAGERPSGEQTSLCPGLAQSENAQDGCLIVPLYDDISPDDQEYVIQALVTSLVRSPHSTKQ